MEIKEAIRRLATTGIEMYCKICQVDAVDKDARACDCSPLDEGAPLLGVNLQADQSGDVGFVLLPTVGSYVVVAFMSDSTAVVVLTTQIDKALVTIGSSEIAITDGDVDIDINGTTMKMNADGIVFNGGNNNGLVKIGDLVGRLNAIEQDINNLKTVFASWVTVPQDGGAALKAASAVWSGKRITPTKQTDIEDTKITH